MRIAGALLLLALPGAASGASWSDQRLTTTAYDGFQDVALAGNSRGDAVIAYAGNRGVEVATARNGGPFGRPRRVPGRSDDYTSGARVAIDEEGHALVLWSYFDNSDPVNPREYRDEGCCVGAKITVIDVHSGHWRKSQRLTPVGTAPQPGAIGIVRGRIAVAYLDGQQAWVRFGGRGRRLGDGRQVTSRINQPIGVHPLRAGAAVSYARRGHEETELVETTVRRGHHRTSRTLESLLPQDVTIAAATNQRGDQAVVWQGYAPGFNEVHAAARKHGRRFRHVRIVADAKEAGYEPHIVISPSGAAAVGWTTGSQLMLSVRRPGKPFPRMRPFDPTLTANYDSPELAIDSAGRLAVGWDQRSAGANAHGYAAFRTLTGQRVGLHDLGFANEVFAAPGGTVDARGRVRLAWRIGGVVSATRTRMPR